MIVLDTNVVSEMMRPHPDERVASWLSRQPSLSVYTTCITEAEIFHGLSLLPAGRRQDALLEAAARIFTDEFSGRILSFGREAARCYATLRATRQQAGQPMSALDAQIASITLISGARLATRNTRDFSGCGLHLVDPWQAA